jgi:hypothetical protein
MDSPKTQFLKIYADVPLGVRREIIAVVEDEPVTWNSARIEVENNTATGRQILDQLIQIGVLNDQKN